MKAEPRTSQRLPPVRLTQRALSVNGRRKRNVPCFGYGPATGRSEAVALAWLLAQRPWIVPIPGTTKLHRLEENLGGVSVELSDSDLARIRERLAGIEVVGARYAETHQRLINR